MLLFRPSKPLRGRFLRIFGPSRPLKPRFSLERVVVFEVFTIFSSHSLLSLSLASFRPFFGSSGHLPASSREAFFWPEGEGEKKAPPLFDVHVSKFASDLPTGTSGGAKRPKKLPNPSQNTLQKLQIWAPSRYFIALWPFLISTKH